jgi:methylated-DNA-protein-cysteine methyltransferase-like protein
MDIQTPPDREAYYQTVWDIVRQVPRGQVVTFGQLAAMIPPPPGIEPPAYDRIAPRWVGYAMNAVSGPDEPTVPWHRVINSKGGISLPEGSRPAVLQRARLEAEGVRFNARGLVDFDACGWDGPDDAWLGARGLLRPHSMRRQGPPPPHQPTLL